MSRYAIKIYEGCPVPTVLWSLTSLIGVLSGIMGVMGLIYVIFPTEETNPQFVLMCAVIGIPVCIISLVLRSFVDKMGQKQLLEKKSQNNME